MSGLYIQYGCGLQAPARWLNFDASPSLRLRRLPGVGRALAPLLPPFPGTVRHGDIVTGLPVSPASARAVYASHVLEHLTFEDCGRALRNTRALLAPGGVFRLVMPDLERHARRYLAGRQAGDAAAAHRFLRDTALGRARRPSGLRGRLSALFGHSAHLWLWDAPAIAGALAQAGFVRIRPCRFGDHDDPRFAEVEEESRFVADGEPELAFEARAED